MRADAPNLLSYTADTCFILRHEKRASMYIRTVRKDKEAIGSVMLLFAAKANVLGETLV
jgi:hypothetical protein